MRGAPASLLTANFSAPACYFHMPQCACLQEMRVQGAPAIAIAAALAQAVELRNRSTVL